MNKTFSFAALLLLATVAVPVRAQDEVEKPVCSSYGDCNTRGTKAYQAKDYAAALDFFEEQLIAAELADDLKQQLTAINNLALAHLKKGEPLWAKAWLGRAKELKADDKATLFNQGEVDKAVAALPARPAIGGAYHAYAGAAQWQSIELKAKGKNAYSFEMLALRLGNNWRQWGPAGIGDLQDDITVKGNKADYNKKMEYADEPCQFHFDFAGDEMDVEQLTPDYQCGFGNGVAASGHYYRTAAP